MEAFLAEIERRAFRMAQLATGNRDDALDIVQDTMIKLVQKYSNHPPSSWKPLFYSILESRIMDWHRRQSVRNRFRSWLDRPSDDEDTEDQLEQQPADISSFPDIQLQDAEFMEHLNQALSEMPLRQQQVFLLRIWEGLDISDTAKAMQCSQSSVKTHYSRALEKLRIALKDFKP
ncbi:MAG: RNA polymerase sigma factor [Methylophilaceae bacterium 17-43-7]|nr:MAG: RNA polymerase sigma factor [Methylophilales bacterium 28-44-11]OYZ70580.1 MAG: RNA polymerase sigma factor [Methylophilaceae bacterium 17-43-7]